MRRVPASDYESAWKPQKMRHSEVRLLPSERKAKTDFGAKQSPNLAALVKCERHS